MTALVSPQSLSRATTISDVFPPHFSRKSSRGLLPGSQVTRQARREIVPSSETTSRYAAYCRRARGQNVSGAAGCGVGRQGLLRHGKHRGRGGIPGAAGDHAARASPRSATILTRLRRASVRLFPGGTRRGGMNFRRITPLIKLKCRVSHENAARWDRAATAAAAA